MEKKSQKPSPEAKALSLFLMAHKKTSNIHKEKAKRINRLWSLVKNDEYSSTAYIQEVQDMLDSFGGYDEVVEKTVRFYIKKTGEWKLEGDDKYCTDARAIADKVLKE